MDIQDQSKATTPSGHICRRCGWPFPNSHPSSKHRRSHKRICGTIEGYTKLIDSEAVSDDDHDDDEHHSDEDIEKTPSPKIEKKIIEVRSSKSEDDLFSDAVTEFSDGGFSTPGAEERFFDTTKLLYSPIELIKGDDNLDVFQTPDTEDKYGSHKDKLVADVAPSTTDNKDQEYVLSVPSDIPVVDKAETLLQDFKDHNPMHSDVPMIPTLDGDKDADKKIEESQTCNNGESTMESAVSEHEVDNGVPVLSEEHESVIEKIVESVGGDSSSRNSLEGNWGSVSVLSTASIDVESKDKSQLGNKPDVFEGHLVDLKEEIVDQKASEIKMVKVIVEDSQPPKSEGVVNENEGRKRNEEAIAKVTNWSTSEQSTASLKNLVSEVKTSSPKQLKIEKDEVAEKVSEVGKSNSVNQETSPPTYIGEEKKVRKKAKGRVSSWVPFACCSSINVS